MRILVVGAGAVGGYFGGRLLEAGRDVTFPVRQGRARELASGGLQIRSSFGDVGLPAPPTVLAEHIAETFDLVLLSCKAYDLADAIRALAPAVGPDTAIVPLLNGIRHFDLLDQEFGAAHVLGGRCLIAATLNGQREIVHLNRGHMLTFGERDGSLSERVRAIENVMAGALFDHRASPHIMLDLWEKWTFLASLAGATCLFRGSIGEIQACRGAASSCCN